MSKMLDALRQLRSRGVDFTPVAVLETLEACPTLAPLPGVEDAGDEESNVATSPQESEDVQDTFEPSADENIQDIEVLKAQELETLRAANGSQTEVVVDYPSDELLKNVWYRTESSSVDPDIGIEVREYRVVSPHDSRAGDLEQSVGWKSDTPIDKDSVEPNSPGPSVEAEEVDGTQSIQPSEASLASTDPAALRVTPGREAIPSINDHERPRNDLQPLPDTHEEVSSPEDDHTMVELVGKSDRATSPIGHAKHSKTKADFENSQDRSTRQPAFDDAFDVVNENLEQIEGLVDAHDTENDKELGFETELLEEKDSCNTVVLREGANILAGASAISKQGPTGAVSAADESISTLPRTTEERIDRDTQKADEETTTVDAECHESDPSIDEATGDGCLPAGAETVHQPLDDDGTYQPLLFDYIPEAATSEASETFALNADQQYDADRTANRTTAENSLQLILESLDVDDVPSRDVPNSGESRQPATTDGENSANDEPLPFVDSQTIPVDSDHDDDGSSQWWIPKDVEEMVDVEVPGSLNASHDVPQYGESSECDKPVDSSIVDEADDTEGVIGGKLDTSESDGDRLTETERPAIYSAMLLDVPEINVNETQQPESHDEISEQSKDDFHEDGINDISQSAETLSTGETSDSTHTINDPDSLEYVVPVNDESSHNAPRGIQDEEDQNPEHADGEQLSSTLVADADDRDQIDSGAGVVEVSDDPSVTHDQECETPHPHATGDCRFTGRFDTRIFEPWRDGQLKQQYIEAADSLTKLANGRPLVLVFAGVGDNDHVVETLLRLTAILIERDAGRVLLIDANASDQTMSSRLDVAGRPGIGDVCKTEFHWQDTLICNVDPCLSFMPRGRCVPHIVSTNILSPIVAEWKREFPFILVDGGDFNTPLAQGLAQVGDASCLIVRLGKTDRERAAETVNRMRRLENFVGTVITS